MKMGQVNKLYSKLTAQQQANLLLAAVAQGNTKEAEAIEASVELKDYRLADMNFHRQLLRLHHLVGTYSREYWRLRALMLYHVNNEQADFASTKLYLDNLLALEQALVTVCQTLKVDLSSVKALAQCLDINDTPSDTELPPANAELVTHFIALLTLH